jgi:hypothetical protein
MIHARVHKPLTVVFYASQPALLWAMLEQPSGHEIEIGIDAI